MKDVFHKIKIIEGDITEQSTDAIVNAANSALRGGGGVDGSIHRKAGAQALLSACQKLAPCPPGEARITSGFQLKAKWIIHTVGPFWRGGENQESHILARCYQNALKLALEHQIRSISFPSISTGVYRFPIEKACPIALSETIAFLKKHPQTLKQVVFVCFDSNTFNIYQKQFQKLMQDQSALEK